MARMNTANALFDLLYLRVILDGGWKVVLDLSDKPPYRGEAIFQPVQKIIVSVRRHRPGESLEATLLHELMHAAFDISDRVPHHGKKEEARIRDLEKFMMKTISKDRKAKLRGVLRRAEKVYESDKGKAKR